MFTCKFVPSVETTSDNGRAVCISSNLLLKPALQPRRVGFLLEIPTRIKVSHSSRRSGSKAKRFESDIKVLLEYVKSIKDITNNGSKYKFI